MSTDWSEPGWKKLLLGPRRFLWREDTIELLARWMEIRPGLTVVDSGCGLGYLGYTFWPWFGEGGRYVGVDENAKLLAEACETSRNWAGGGRASFVKGDCYRLPLPDGRADWSVCQTLLMHLTDPGRVVAELARVVRPGGLVTLIEPDNLAAQVRGAARDWPGLSIDDRLALVRLNLEFHTGRIALGRGDWGIGNHLNRLLHEAGLERIDVRQCDCVNHLEPPYESPRQEWLLGALREEARGSSEDERPKAYVEAVVAGGGTKEEVDRAHELLRNERERSFEELDEAELYSCTGGPLYVATGRKPE